MAATNHASALETKRKRKKKTADFGNASVNFMCAFNFIYTIIKRY